MKQGRASREVYEGKVEPKPHAISIEKVSEIGCSVVTVKPPLYEGRGYKAPMNASEESHHCGSQGKH